MDSTLLKGLATLEALVRAGSERSVSELAQQLRLGRSNVHRTLQTLVHAGYADQNESSAKYRPTLRLWELGTLVAQQMDLRERARDHLERLSQKSGESVLLAALDGLEVVYLDKIDATHPIGAFSKIGGRAPAYCTALGKAMLSVAPPVVLESLPERLERHTSTTVTTRVKLLHELVQARKRGYAVNRGEWREGVYGVAAPILGLAGQVIGSIAISGPKARLGSHEQQSYGELLVACAKQISTRLGVGMAGKSGDSSLA